MLDVEIQPDVPIPAINQVNRPFVYPFIKMKVGDSFAVPIQKKRSLRASASNYSRRHGFKFKTRIVIKGKTETVRIWRVK